MKKQLVPKLLLGNKRALEALLPHRTLEGEAELLVSALPSRSLAARSVSKTFPKRVIFRKVSRSHEEPTQSVHPTVNLAFLDSRVLVKVNSGDR